MPKACVVIPTINEGRIIEQVIGDIRDGFKTTRYTEVVILIVDDSSDDTREIAVAAGAQVVRGEGEGLGAAMYKGLKSALKYEPDVIMLVDGDGQADPATEIPKFLEPIDRGEADLVLGSRFLEKGLVQYKYPAINRFGVIVLSRILRAQTGLPLTDSHGGIRAMIPSVVADLEMLGSHTYVQETIIDAAEKNYRVVEIPSIWRKREAGKSRVVGSITKYVLYTLPILILRSGQHIRYLYSLGILCVIGGLAVFGIVLVQEGYTIALLHRTPALVLIALLVSTGLQLFFFGFILQLLKQMKKNIDRQLQLGLRLQGQGDDDR